jgi:hypothetical protein
MSINSSNHESGVQNSTILNKNSTEIAETINNGGLFTNARGNIYNFIFIEILINNLNFC